MVDCSPILQPLPTHEPPPPLPSRPPPLQQQQQQPEKLTWEDLLKSPPGKYLM